MFRISCAGTTRNFKRDAEKFWSGQNGAEYLEASIRDVQEALTDLLRRIAKYRCNNCRRPFDGGT